MTYYGTICTDSHGTELAHCPHCNGWSNVVDCKPRAHSTKPVFWLCCPFQGCYASFLATWHSAQPLARPLETEEVLA